MVGYSSVVLGATTLKVMVLEEVFGMVKYIGIHVGI
jgi:hypothetical protein